LISDREIPPITNTRTNATQEPKGRNYKKRSAKAFTIVEKRFSTWADVANDETQRPSIKNTARIETFGALPSPD